MCSVPLQHLVAPIRVGHAVHTFNATSGDQQASTCTRTPSCHVAYIKLFVHAAVPWCYVMPPCRYLEENVGALAVQLTADELKELEAALPAHKVSGSRLRSRV